jgi:hypothetical protein
MALITLFIAGYKMSRRQVQEMLADVLGIVRVHGVARVIRGSTRDQEHDRLAV